MEKILIRADDLGYSEAVNYGIEKSVKDGLIASVGVMTNMPPSKHGVNLLKMKILLLVNIQIFVWEKRYLILT